MRARSMLGLLAAVSAAACDTSPAPPRVGPSQATAEEIAAAQASYDRYRRPDLLVAALHIRAGNVIADVGAGTGYLEPWLAAAAGPTGRIVATDIDGAALTELRRRRLAETVPRPGAPVETRIVTADDPGLEPGAYDLVLLVQVDHLLDDRADYLRRAKGALARGGHLVVSNRLTYREKVYSAAVDAGFEPVFEATDLPGQFLLDFVPRPPVTARLRDRGGEAE